MDAGALVAAYLSQLSEAGIALRQETAQAMISERVAHLASALALPREAAACLIDVHAVRAWGREAGAQLRDEQPRNPRLAGVPRAFVPVGILAQCIVALLEGHPPLAERGAAVLVTYPTILLGGTATVRCHATDLREFSDALDSIHPELSRCCILLAELAQAG